MTKDERDRAKARFNKAAKVAEDAKTGKKDVMPAQSRSGQHGQAEGIAPREGSRPARAAGRGGQEAARQISKAILEERRRPGATGCPVSKAEDED